MTEGLGKTAVMENIPFTIDPVRVLREMRIPHVKSLDEIEERPLADSIKKAIDRAYTLISGKGVFTTYRLTGAEGDAVTGEGTGKLFSGPGMVKLLGDCGRATLLACTIGPALEQEAERMQSAGDITGAYILDMIGGWMADYMADRVDERIEREIRRSGCERTMRFSPGYGEWGLENQPEVLRLAGADRIGIKLTETNIMIPRKSVSAVIGWKRP